MNEHITDVKGGELLSPKVVITIGRHKGVEYTCAVQGKFFVNAASKNRFPYHSVARVRPVCKGTFSLPYKKFSPAWFCEVPRSRFFCRQGKNTQEYWRISSIFNTAYRKICPRDRMRFDSLMPKH